MVPYINECDTDNNDTWTMDSYSLHHIVHSFLKKYSVEYYKFNDMIQIIATYVADRDFAWYNAVEIAEEGDGWEYGIGEVEDAEIKELRHNSDDCEFGVVHCELYVETGEKEDTVSIALGASHDTDVGIITAYWFIRIYRDNSLVESNKGDIAIDQHIMMKRKLKYLSKKRCMDSTHILIGMKLSAHDLCYPSIKYALIPQSKRKYLLIC